MIEKNLQRKKSGKAIGGLGRQYAGVNGETSRSLEPSDVEQPGFSNTQISDSLSVQKSKRSKRERDKLTVYLDPEVNTWIRHRIADTREEISEVVNDAIRRLMDSK